MIDNDGAAPAVAPDAPVEVASPPPFDATRPRLIEPVPIMLDKERHLTLSFESLNIFEQHTGVSPWDSDIVFGWPPSLSVITTLLWVGLREEDPTLTLEQTWKLPGLSFGNINYIRHQLDLCWGKNMPPPEPKGVNGTAPNVKSPAG